MQTFANHYRERAVALLATLFDGAGADRLAVYAPEGEAADLAQRLRHYAAIAPEARAAACREQLRGLRTAEEMTLLHEIHPGWLVTVLERESPRVVGLLLRHLPSRHVRYLLEHLPERITKHLPQVIDAFAVAPEILQLVRRRFERHFVPIRPVRALDTFGFADLGHLRSEDLEVLIHDLGLTELALAFRRMDRKALRIIFNRLPFRDAKALKERIESAPSVDPLLERDAKGTIFEMTLEDGGTDIALKAIGLLAVAKALGGGHLPMVAIVRQKLAPKWGYLLTRSIDAYVGRQHPACVASRQRLILERVAALSVSGAIDPQWQALISDHEIREVSVETSAGTVPSPGAAIISTADQGL